MSVRSESVGRLIEAASELLQPPSRLTVSEWADAHRLLDTSSAEPGPWRCSRTPYLTEPMEAMSPASPVETVVLMFASQVGKSEAINNAIGHAIHLAPGPMMLVQPTIDTARDYSRQRLAPMFRATPALRERVSESRSRDSDTTILQKRFPGGFLRVSGANSSASLASTPIRRLYMDEVDRYPLDVDGEGDPCGLAVTRTSTFVGKRKIVMTSTPTIKGKSRIEAAYLASDQRRFYVPCPQCGHVQTLEWRHLQWEPHKPRTAVYVCPRSGCVIENHHKTRMLPLGEWRPTADTGHDRVRGYHLSALYAPHGLGPSFADLAEQFSQAKGDPARLKVFLNTRSAETWDVSDGKTVDHEGLAARAEDRDWREELPGEVVLLTAGVDVQADRVECEVVGWAPGYESWSIAYEIIHGDPKGKELWEALDDVLTRRYLHPTGVTLPIAAVAIDSGYSANDTYRYCRPRLKHRRWAIKGGNHTGQVWPVRASMGGKWKNTPVYAIDESTGKMHVYDRLQIEERGPGFCHFPADRHDEWYRQLTAEQYREVFERGIKKVKWTQLRKRNEALDCRVYAYASLLGWEAGGTRSLEKAQARLAAAAGRLSLDDEDRAPAPTTRKPARQDAMGRPRGSYWAR